MSLHTREHVEMSTINVEDSYRHERKGGKMSHTRRGSICGLKKKIPGADFLGNILATRKLRQTKLRLLSTKRN